MTGEFFASLGMPSKLQEVGIKEDNFEAMAKHATVNGKIGDFKPLEAQDVQNIYKAAL